MNLRKLTYLEATYSTNDEILPFLANADEEIIGIYTFHQTKGRGQYGNSWESPKNNNIAFSIAIPTNFVNISDSLFNFYTALQLRNFVANLTKKNSKIKWPNDLILNKKKIAGILIEKVCTAKYNYFIVGFGLNVLQTEFENLPTASSLMVEAPMEYNLHEISEELFIHLKKQYTYELLTCNILAEYENHLFKKDKVAVYEINNIRQNGIIKNVDENGYLYVELDSGEIEKFYHKEIKMLY